MLYVTLELSKYSSGARNIKIITTNIKINESKHIIKYGTQNEVDRAVVQAVKPAGYSRCSPEFNPRPFHD
jgi:hypothetical protein